MFLVSQMFLMVSPSDGGSIVAHWPNANSQRTSNGVTYFNRTPFLLSWSMNTMNYYSICLLHFPRLIKESLREQAWQSKRLFLHVHKIFIKCHQRKNHHLRLWRQHTRSGAVATTPTSLSSSSKRRSTQPTVQKPPSKNFSRNLSGEAVHTKPSLNSSEESLKKLRPIKSSRVEEVFTPRKKVSVSLFCLLFCVFQLQF